MPISRRVLWTFLSVAVVLCAELGWWVTFNVRSSAQQTREALDRMQRDVHLAEAVIDELAQVRGPHGTDPTALLQRHFPDLAWGPAAAATVPRNEGALAVFYPGQGVTVRPEALARVHNGHASHARMFMGEGGFFLAMVLVGVTLIFRTLRREVGVVRQQSNFLAAVSHELKSPLASIRLYTETLQLRDVDASTRQRYLGIMRADIDRLETLVGNLLAVARLDHGEYKGHPQHVDVAAEVRHVVDDMAEEMRARGAAVQLTGPDGALMAYVDPAILTTVMRNILDNAAKYNQHNAPVDIRLQQEADIIVICVIDRGIGLEAAELTRIFKKFYRVGDEMVRQTEGSGLGLYLVDALWRQSGGRVRALSDGVGRGTTFELRVPSAGAAGTTV